MKKLVLMMAIASTSFLNPAMSHAETDLKKAAFAQSFTEPISIPERPFNEDLSASNEDALNAHLAELAKIRALDPSLRKFGAEDRGNALKPPGYGVKAYQKCFQEVDGNYQLVPNLSENRKAECKSLETAVLLLGGSIGKDLSYTTVIKSLGFPTNSPLATGWSAVMDEPYKQAHTGPPVGETLIVPDSKAQDTVVDLRGGRRDF